MRTALDSPAKDLLFNEARTHSKWVGGEVSEDLMRKMFDLAKMAPTSANCSPGRFVFVATAEGKEKLKPALAGGNVDQTMNAACTVIIAHDMEFYEQLPKLYPHTDARSWFTGNDTLIKETAFRNGTLQGAYLMIAARALGLDVGPMSGFDQAKVDEIFFAGTTYKSNFLCNIGHGDDSRLHARSPRFDFEEACRIV